MSGNPPGVDPRRLGAQCDRCFLRALRDGPPVLAEINRRARAVVIGEAPGSEECQEGRPFVGASGRELTTSLHSLGVAREDVSFANAVACRPPSNDMDRLLHRCQQENKKRVARGEEPYLTPIEACRPRLYTEINRYTNVVTVGKTALRTLTGMTNSIMDLRGAPVTGILLPTMHGEQWLPRETLDPDGKDPSLVRGRFMRVLPTIHPSFVLRMRRWTKVFRTDLGRAFRWFNGNLGWKEPKALYQPTLAEAREFLYSGAPFYAYDVETDAKESLLARLRCIGIGTPDAGMVIPLLSVDGFSRFYSPDEEEAMMDLLRGWFTDRRITKVGWNAGMYDRIVIETRLGVTPVPLVDGMIVHACTDSELPHNLAFVGALFTDVARAWKASHAAVNAQSDTELHVYNLGDCVVNARIMDPLIDACKMRGQLGVTEWLHVSQSVCVGLHKNGMNIDQGVRRALDEKYRKEAQEHLHILRMSIGEPDFNPNSVLKVRELLFDKWALTPLSTTSMGDPSTDDDTLRKLLLVKTLTPQQKDFLRSMRKFRRATKYRGTFIHPLRPFDEPMYEDDPLATDVTTREGAAMQDDEDEVLVEEDPQGDLAPTRRKVIIGKAPGLVLADGRVHSNWNAHTPTSSRKSSSGPNAQNFPRPLRGMFTAAEGRMLTASDYDQLELRISAAYAGASRYLEAFRDPNGDPHSVTAESLYGATFRNGSAKDRKRIRDFAKRFVYAVIYGATVETIHETIAAAENDKGELIFPWVTLRETDALVRRWLKENYEYERWWDHCIENYRRDGFIEEPVLGRRRFFLDGEDRNEIINMGVQAGGAACVIKAERALIEGPMPFEKWGPGTGLIQNGHDALMSEAPCPHCHGKPYKGADAIFGGHPPLAKGERCPVVDASHWTKEAMTMKLPGYDVLLTATPKIGFSWSEC